MLKKIIIGTLVLVVALNVIESVTSSYASYTERARVAALSPAQRAAEEEAKAEAIAREESAKQKRLDDAIAAFWRDRCSTAKRGKAMIGDTPEAIRKCGWGKPEEINRTTTAGTVREQWVYGVGNYLYFTDGVLTAIQN